MSETDGYRDESADAWGECAPGPRGMPLIQPGLQANASLPEITVFGLSWHPRKRRVQTSKMVMQFTGITQ